MDRPDTQTAQLDSETIAALRALVDPGRLRIVGLLAARPMTRIALGEALHQPPTALIKPLEQLIAAELVEARPAKGGALFALRGDRVGALGRTLASLDRGGDRATGELAALTGLSADDARVLRGYLEDGRLTTIPAAAAKRLVILRWLRDQVFTEDREYPEKEVNQRIALIHPDPAALRRYLVDEGLVTREAGRYRRRAGAGALDPDRRPVTMPPPDEAAPG